MRVWLLAAACAMACGDRMLAPYGEAFVIVDVDVPIPRIAGRLRLDVYSSDGTRWIDSREAALLGSKDWPTSFGVYDTSDDAAVTVLVRVRAFPQGITREYRGERYTTKPDATPPDAIVEQPDATDGPVLRDATGANITPRTEPAPGVTIDRLVLVHIEPGHIGSVHIVLHGACIGTMADLAQRRSCVSTEDALEPALVVPLEAGLAIPDPVPRTFGARTPCNLPLRNSTPGLFDDEICVPGGAFVFGNSDGFGEGEFTTLPQRVAVVPPFRMDKFEVTVGRWRKAVADGFVSPDNTPVPNDGMLGLGEQTACTWTSNPTDREAYPLNCISIPAAKAFCERLGGSLPREVEWQWVVQDAERPRKTEYAWGDDPPTCSHAVFGRQTDNNFSFNACLGLGRGPQPEDALAGQTGDVALGTGITNLVGSMSEFLDDAFHGYDRRCWASNALASPRCIDDASASSTTSGASWADNVVSTLARTRRFFPRTADTVEIDLGFRCVRRTE